MSASFRFVKDSSLYFLLFEPFRPCTIQEDVSFWRTLFLLPFACMLRQSKRATPFACPDDPVSQSRDMRYFHKNESSWCANNVTRDGTLLLTHPLPAPDTERCLCDRVAIEPVDGETEYENATGPAAGDPITVTRERYRETETEDL